MLVASKGIPGEKGVEVWRGERKGEKNSMLYFLFRFFFFFFAKKKKSL